MDIGKIIAKLRKQKGMTQEKLAQMVGVSVPAVSKWETGNTLPDIMLLSPIARALGTNIDYLLSYKSELTEDEVKKLLDDIRQECEVAGFRSGMTKAFNLLKEYPNSDYLKLRVADASLSLTYTIEDDYTEAEHNELMEKTTHLFEQITDSKDVHISIAAKIALATRYMVAERFNEAEEILNQLPKTECNGERVLPTLYLMKKELDKSLEISQRMLLKDIQYIQMDILSMYNVKMKQKKYKEAICFVENYRTLDTMYGKHFQSGADLMVNVYLKMNDIENALKWFEIYVDDIIKMNMNYQSTIYFDCIASEIVTASNDLEDNIKIGLYKSILLDPKYNVLKEKQEYKKCMAKLQNYIEKIKK